jgi:hypothetical protein
MALAILTTLLGSQIALKVYTLIKILGLNVEGWTQQDFEELLKNDKRFKKYMR